jgi:hypothetical protein
MERSRFLASGDRVCSIGFVAGRSIGLSALPSGRQACSGRDMNQSLDRPARTATSRRPLILPQWQFVSGLPLGVNAD